MALTIAVFISTSNFAQHVIDVEQKLHEHERTTIPFFGSRSQLPTALFIDITHVNMRIGAEPNRQDIYGDVTISYKINKELDTLCLDFDSSNAMSVDVVQVDNRLNRNYFRKGNFLVIPIGLKLSVNQSHKVRVVHQGELCWTRYRKLL
jgi:hypothetical protein